MTNVSVITHVFFSFFTEKEQFMKPGKHPSSAFTSYASSLQSPPPHSNTRTTTTSSSSPPGGLNARLGFPIPSPHYPLPGAPSHHLLAEKMFNPFVRPPFLPGKLANSIYTNLYSFKIVCYNNYQIMIYVLHWFCYSLYKNLLFKLKFK